MILFDVSFEEHLEQVVTSYLRGLGYGDCAVDLIYKDYTVSFLINLKGRELCTKRVYSYSRKPLVNRVLNSVDYLVKYATSNPQ